MAANRTKLPIALAALPGGGLGNGIIAHVEDQVQDFQVQIEIAHKVRGFSPIYSSFRFPPSETCCVAGSGWLQARGHSDRGGMRAVHAGAARLLGLERRRDVHMQDDWDEEACPEGFTLGGAVPPAVAAAAAEPAGADAAGMRHRRVPKPLHHACKDPSSFLSWDVLPPPAGPGPSAIASDDEDDLVMMDAPAAAAAPQQRAGQKRAAESDAGAELEAGPSKRRRGDGSADDAICLD